MRADILTIFPGFFRGPLDHGITRRACEMGLAEIQVHDLRGFTHDKHRTVDDRPFGGGEGMVLKPEPLFECLDTLQLAPREDRVARRVKQSGILLSAQGQRFTQKVAAELATPMKWLEARAAAMVPRTDIKPIQLETAPRCSSFTRSGTRAE